MCASNGENTREHVLLVRTCLVTCSPDVRVSKCKQTDSEVREIVSELKEKHESKYSLPQLWLWARMIISGNHECR